MNRRLMRASTVAPLTVPLLYLIGNLAAALADPVRRPTAGQNLGDAIIVVFAAGAPLAYAATFLVALPILWVMRRAGPLTLRRTVLVGFAVGAGVAFALEPWLRGDVVSIPLPRWSGGVLGAVAAAAWWWLAYADIKS